MNYAKGIFFLLLMVNGIVKAQTYDLYIANDTMTTNKTMEFDVYIKNNGISNDWALRTFQSGYHLNPAFVNLGTLAAMYVPGSSELEATFGKTWGFSYSSSQTTINQSANIGSSCPGALISSAPRKIMRIKITNSVSWGCADDSLSLVTSGASVLSVSVSKYDSPDCSSLNVSIVTGGATTYVIPIPHSFEVAACDSYLWYGTTYTTSGTYLHTYTNPADCFITDTLKLTIGNGTNWTGSVSDEWENPANWSCGSVPDINTIVYIDAPVPNYPVIRSMAFCKKIFTGPGTTVTVNPGFRLDVVGTD